MVGQSCGPFYLTRSFIGGEVAGRGHSGIYILLHIIIMEEVYAV